MLKLSQIKNEAKRGGCSIDGILKELRKYKRSYNMLGDDKFLEEYIRKKRIKEYFSHRKDLLKSLTEFSDCVSINQNRENDRVLSNRVTKQLKVLEIKQNESLDLIKTQNEYASSTAQTQISLLEKSKDQNYYLRKQDALLREQRKLLYTQNQILQSKSSYLSVGSSTEGFHSAGVYSELGNLYKTWKWKFVGGVHALVKRATLTGVKATIGFARPLILAKEERSSFKYSRIVLGVSPNFFLDNGFIESIVSPEILIIRNTIGVGYHWSENVGHEFKILFAFR